MALPEEDLHPLKELKSRSYADAVCPNADAPCGPLVLDDPVAASLMQKKTAQEGHLRPSYCASLWDIVPSPKDGRGT